MDVGDLLNALAAIFVILIAIMLSLNLPYLSAKYIFSYNPFSIYQTAIYLNYIYTYPGNYSAEIKYDGKYLWRYELRISNSSESYISIGECFEKDHLSNIASDLFSSLLFTVGSIKVSGVTTRIADLSKQIIFYSLDIAKASIIFTEITRIISLFSYSGGDINKFIKSFIVTYHLNSPIEAISSKLEEYGKITSEILTRNLLSTLIRFAVSKVLASTGIGIVVVFLANFAIGLADNIYDWFLGFWDVRYNCLKDPGFGKQLIYNESEKVIYSQNRNLY
ncbi:MAG: hypothetical protein QW483_01470, partial [Nanopusillaceae archaeon]